MQARLHNPKAIERRRKAGPGACAKLPTEFFLPVKVALTITSCDAASFEQHLALKEADLLRFQLEDNIGRQLRRFCRKNGRDNLTFVAMRR